jgi:signal transduction histidine kinase
MTMAEKPSVLVVDDEAMNVDLLKSILQSSQYHVLSASNGLEALEVLSRQKVDLVLLDVTMPLMDGFEVTRKIRAGQSTKGLAVILITGLHGISERITGIEAGCDDFITKPFDKNELLARIRTLLRLNFYRSQVDEKEKFEHLINMMNDGLIVCDSGLNIIRSNQKVRELLNLGDFSPAWLAGLGATFSLGYHGDLAGDLRAKDLDFDMERPETPVAKPLILSFSSSVIKDTDGKAASVVIVIHDVTQNRKEQFEKESFLSLMSEKMRAPLGVSLDHLSLLQKSTEAIENKPFKKSVEITVDKVTEFLKMIEKIFDFLTVNSMARFNENAPKKDAVSTEQVVSLIKSLVKAHENKKVESKFDLPLGLDLPIGLDLLEIMLKNLIENAVKFNDQEAVKLNFAASKGADRVRFTVSDNGLGIPGEEWQNIFGIFYQAYKRGSVAVPGQGLGLAIVKKIVEKHQGEIMVDFPSHGGTSISFTLPFQVAGK